MIMSRDLFWDELFSHAVACAGSNLLINKALLSRYAKSICSDRLVNKSHSSVEASQC
jgi:hypothetical protein